VLRYVKALRFATAANIQSVGPAFSLSNSDDEVLRKAKAGEVRGFILALPFLLHNILEGCERLGFSQAGSREDLDKLATLAHKGLSVYALAMDHYPPLSAPEEMKRLIREFESSVRDTLAKDEATWFLKLDKAHDMRHLPEAMREIGPVYYAAMQAFERAHKSVKCQAHNNHDGYVWQVASRTMADRGADILLQMYGSTAVSAHRRGAEGPDGRWDGDWGGGFDIVACEEFPVPGGADLQLVRYKLLRLPGDKDGAGDKVEVGAHVLFVWDDTERVGTVHSIMMGAGGLTFVAIQEHPGLPSGPLAVHAALVFGRGQVVLYGAPGEKLFVVLEQNVKGVATLFPWRQGSLLRSLKVDAIGRRGRLSG